MKPFFYIFMLFTFVGCNQSQDNEKEVTISPKMKSIIKITSEQLGVSEEKIREDSTFASLGADDLDLVEITMTAEDTHKVSISDELLIKIAKVSSSEEVVHNLTIAGFTKALESAEPEAEGEKDENVVTGLYSDLVIQPLPDGYSYLFMPSLVAILKAAEDKKGLALTKDEVLSIRDHAPAMVAPNDVILHMNKSRQYQDIDSQAVWSEWQQIRIQLK